MTVPSAVDFEGAPWPEQPPLEEADEQLLPDVALTYYHLIDPDGLLAAVHVRLDHAGGKRLFWQLPDGTRGLGGRPLSSLPLYRLLTLVSRPDEEVYVCEGEKAADALAGAGYCAVGTVTGAAAIPDADVLSVLAGRHVVLWEDNDDPGTKHMDAIAARLDGVAASVAFVEWPDAPAHGDAADFLEMHPGSDVARLPRSPYEEPRPVAEGAAQPPRGALTLAEFLAEEDGEVWALPGCVPRGGFVVAVGSPESFKTQGGLTLALAFAGAIPEFLGVAPAECLPVLYVSNEKSGRMVRARLRRMIAEGRIPRQPFLVLHRQGVHFARESWNRVREALADFGCPALVVLDTLASLSPPGFDENSGRDMSLALDAIRGIQSDYGATIILLHHPSKYGQGPAGARARGHTSLWGEVDAVWLFERPDRTSSHGLLRLDVKDADQQVIPFRWDPDTFLLQRGVAPDLSLSSVVAVVGSLWSGEGIKSAQIVEAFAPRHGRSAVMDCLSKAVSAGLVVRGGKGNATRYSPSDGQSGSDDVLAYPNAPALDE